MLPALTEEGSGTSRAFGFLEVVTLNLRAGRAVEGPLLDLSRGNYDRRTARFAGSSTWV